MSGQQGLVAVGGIGLIGANYWLGGARQTVKAGALTPGATTAQTTAAHQQLKTVLIELMFVGVGVLLAGISDAAGSAALAVLVALGVLWAINHYTTPTA